MHCKICPILWLECMAFVMQKLIDFISLIRITGKAIATAIEVTKLG